MPDDITDEMVLRAAFGMCIHGCYPHPNRSGPSYHPPCSRCMSNARKAIMGARTVDPLVAENDRLRVIEAVIREAIQRSCDEDDVTYDEFWADGEICAWMPDFDRHGLERLRAALEAR